MDPLLSSIKAKLSLDDKLYFSITNIILNAHIADKKEHFNHFLFVAKTPNKPLPQILISALLLYVMDIHKNFKAELLLFIKKHIQSVLELFVSFFSIVDISLLATKDTFCLKTKAILLNNLYDFYKKVLLKESIDDHANKSIMTQLLKEYYLFFTQGDLEYLLKNINDDVELVLSFIFNSFVSLVKGIDDKDNDCNNKLKEIQITFKQSMINTRVGYRILYKDFFSNISNLFFWILQHESKTDPSIFRNKALTFLDHFSREHEIVLIYFKSMVNNLHSLNDNTQLLSLSFDCLKDIIDTSINKTNSNIEYSNSLTMLSFFKLFLETNWYRNYSILINDLFIAFIRKFNQTSNESLIDFINQSKIIPSLFSKLKQEKENIGFIEDNYFIIIEELIRINKEYSYSISQEVKEYFKQLISLNSKTTINECSLFSFVTEDSLEIRKDYLDYLLSQPFEKKNIQHICEYSKLFFDFCSQTKKDDNIFFNNYPPIFLKYLSQIHIRDLKYLNNLLVNFEKSNSAYLQYLINYIYSIYKKSYSLILTLLKPYKTHKKVLYATDKAICFKNPALEIDISFSIDELNEIAKSTDLSLILLMIEFLNEFENCNQIFPIIKTIMKYNIKSSYAEYKSGIMKSITVYFNFYFNKIAKLCSKAKKSTEDTEYITQALSHFSYSIGYLTDNIYNRPVESLLPYLEITKLFIGNTDKLIIQVSKKDLVSDYVNCYHDCVFNKGLCCVLIGLLNHSWYFVRVNTFDILKHEKFTVIISEMKDRLIKEIEKNLFSLRQMDAEGCSYLFLILLYHLKKDFFYDYFNQQFNYSIIENETGKESCCSIGDLICKSINSLNDIIRKKTPEYILILSKPTKDDNEFIIKAQSIHSFYILIQTLLSLEKGTLISENKLTKTTIDSLMNVSNQILNLNGELIKYLINNGVSEFSTESIEEDDQFNDNEDKRLISLWCTSKYSLATLSIVLEMCLSNYFMLNSIALFEETILKPITSILHQLISLILASKHMGIVYLLSDCLYKASSILIKSNEKYKAYHDIPFSQIKLFIESKLIKEEISSTLRRSAGIPFLIVSLIRSYIASQFSSQTINEILQYSIKSLLNSYSQYQFSNPDVSVHSLHIIRLISDDTYIKPFMKDLNDLIILRIIDGLQSENWSVKNACMLMLSRVIKTNFSSAPNLVRILPTFVAYFKSNPDFLIKIKEILAKHSKGVEINDCLLLLITFFTKFKETKPNECNDKDLNELLELFFALEKKNNKLFRKLLTNAIHKMIGGDNIKLNNYIIAHLGDIDLNKEEGNNQLDFYYNLIVSLIKINRDIGQTKNTIAKCIEVVRSKWSFDNYFSKTKVVQMIKKYNNNVNYNKFKDNSDIIELPNDLMQLDEIGIDCSKKAIDMSVLFNRLTTKNRVFYYYKFIKHSIDFHLRLDYELNNINLLSLFNSLKAEELIVYLFKRFPMKLSPILSLKSLIEEIALNGLLSKVSVNISSRIAVYIHSNCKSIPIDLCSQSITTLITTAKEEKEKSKLIIRLLPLIGLLIQIYPQKLNKDSSLVLSNVLLDYSYGHHIEKIRNANIQCVVKIVQSNSDISIIDNAVLFKILFIFLNDENPEIRNTACKLSLIINTINAKALFKAEDDIVYSNEFIVKQLLKNKMNSSLIDISMNKKEPSFQNAFREFIAFVFEENLYFNENKSHMNNNAKVFFFEPDNKYIDNIECKLIIVKAKLLSLFPKKKNDTVLETITESISIDLISFFMPKKQYTINVQHQLTKLLSNGSLSKDKAKFIFNLVRLNAFKVNY